MLTESALAEPVREAALAVFQSLAEAEAQAHNEPIERVHFHEVGAVDAIADVETGRHGPHEDVPLKPVVIKSVSQK